MTPNNFKLFFKEYNATVNSLIEIIIKLPYFRLKNAATFVNQADPYIFASKDIELIDCRRALIFQLIQVEQLLNKAMQAAQLPLLTMVYDAYHSTFELNENELLNKKLMSLIVDLRRKSDIYKDGGHVFLGRVNKEKVAAIDTLLKNVDEVLKANQLDLTQRSLLLYKHCLNAANENIRITSKENKSPAGEFSKLVP